VLAGCSSSKDKDGEDVWHSDCPKANNEAPFNYAKWREDLGGENWIPLSAKSCYEQLDGVNEADIVTQGDIFPQSPFNGEGWNEVRDRKIWICQGTASEVKPYDLIYVNANALCGTIFNEQHNSGNSLEKRVDKWPGQTFSAEGEQYQALCNCDIVLTDQGGNTPEGETKQVDDGNGGKQDVQGAKDEDKSSISAKGQGSWSVLFDSTYGYGFRRNPTLGAMVLVPGSGGWIVEASIDRWVGLMKTGNLKTFVYGEATTGAYYKAEISEAGLGEFLETTLPELPPAIGVWKAATTQDICLNNSESKGWCFFQPAGSTFNITKEGIARYNEQGDQFWRWDCDCEEEPTV